MNPKIDTVNLKMCRPMRKTSEFLNFSAQGNDQVRTAIEAILNSSDVGAKTENLVSPRAFSKFFSRDDLIDNVDDLVAPRPNEADTDSEESYDESLEDSEVCLSFSLSLFLSFSLSLFLSFSLSLFLSFF